MKKKLSYEIKSYSLQFLYQSEAEKIYYFSANHFETFMDHFQLEDVVRDKALSQCKGIYKDLSKIDAYIEGASKSWSLSRMASTDRSILRIAIYELLETDQTIRLILNEAIQLAKEYGTENSGKFVNGLLNNVAQQIRPSEK